MHEAQLSAGFVHATWTSPVPCRSAAQAEHNPQLVADALTYGQQQLATGQFPRLAALYQQQSAADQKSNVDPLTVQFEHGLVALLDGLTRARTATMPFPAGQARAARHDPRQTGPAQR